MTTTIEKTTLATVELNGLGLSNLLAKIEKMNRRADRLGLEPMTTKVTTREVVNKTTGYATEIHTVEINGCAPCIEGWSLAARIENNDVVGTVVHVVPGRFADDDYSGYRESGFDCDHCNTRRRRNDVYVIVDADGNKKVVGRNCLADFIRTDDAASLAAWAEWHQELTNFGDEDPDEFELYERGGNPGPVALTTFLQAVRACTVKIGWTSRTTAKETGENATADDAYFLLFGSGEAHKKFVEYFDLHNCSDYSDWANNAVKWAQALTSDQTANNEYLYTIHKIAVAERTDHKLAGYAASIGNAFQRATEKEARAKAAKIGKVHIGEVGERLKNQTVKVVRVRYSEGHYGVSTIVAMEIAMPDGTIAPLTWFASGSKEFNEGAEYIFAGTVKSHEDSPRFGPQTKVNRCKLVEK